MSTWSSRERLQWAQVDVFAEARYQGNPLAIFANANGLTTEQMQSLARETNLSETTFILPEDPAKEREKGVRVRIFTVKEELPFAGHPTLGTASWIRASLPHFADADEVRLRLNAGTIPVRFQSASAEEDGVYGEMRQRDPEFGAAIDAGAVAGACSLNASDLHATLRPQVVSTGLPFCIVPLVSLEALAKLRVDEAALAHVLSGAGAAFVYAIAQTGDTTWRARMPFYGADDPATGSAAGCCISYLVRHGAASSGERITIHQGAEVHRPSRIDVRASHSGDRITDVFVGGRTIFVAEGRFTHP